MEYHSSENKSLVDDDDDDQDVPTSVSKTGSASPIFYELDSTLLTDDAPSPKKRFVFLFCCCILCYKVLTCLWDIPSMFGLGR